MYFEDEREEAAEALAKANKERIDGALSEAVVCLVEVFENWRTNKFELKLKKNSEFLLQNICAIARFYEAELKPAEVTSTLNGLPRGEGYPNPDAWEQ